MLKSNFENMQEDARKAGVPTSVREEPVALRIGKPKALEHSRLFFCHFVTLIFVLQSICPYGLREDRAGSVPPSSISSGEGADVRTLVPALFER